MAITKISKHVSYREAVRSDLARRNNLENTPNDTQLKAMKTVAKKIFEPLRAAGGDFPIRINSFFRSIAVNKAAKGSSSSQHCRGEAMDLDSMYSGGFTNKEMFDYIRENLDFDQLIWEYGTDKEPDWVHVSFTTRRPNRKIILKAVRGRGYIPYSD
jgi:hypothetical protein